MSSQLDKTTKNAQHFVSTLEEKDFFKSMSLSINSHIFMDTVEGSHH